MSKVSKTAADYYKDVLTMSIDDQRITLEEARSALAEELDKIEKAIDLIDELLNKEDING